MPNVRWIWFPVAVVLRFVTRNARRIAVTVAGFGLVTIGVVLLVIPGPGIALIVAGLAVLASEYVWAQRALNYARRAVVRAKDRAMNRPARGVARHD